MSQLHGSADWMIFLVDGCDMLAAKPKSAVWTIAANNEASTGLGDRFDAVTPTGLTKLTLVQTGAFWDTTPGGIHDTFKTPSPVARTVMLGPGGNTPGAPTLVINGVVTASYDVVATVGSLTKGNVTYQVNGPASSGALAAPLQTKTADWDTTPTPSDNLVATTTGGSATLSMTAITGTVTIKVRHSPDGTTWADLITFDPVSAPGTQTKTVSGTINRYTAITGDIATTGTVTCAVSVQRNP